MFRITVDRFVVTDNFLNLYLIVRTEPGLAVRFAHTQVDMHSEAAADLLYALQETHARNVRRAEVAAEQKDTPLDLPWS